MGYTIGRWEGDSLILDSIGFTDETWLARGGWFHSDQMRVIEKFTRTGNQMTYEVTVEDPVMLLKPWVMPTITMREHRRQHDHRRARKLLGGRARQTPARSIGTRRLAHVPGNPGAAVAAAPGPGSSPPRSLHQS